jgi:hypothetical protein
MSKGSRGEKRPRDPNQLAKLIADIATNEDNKDEKPTLANKPRNKR